MKHVLAISILVTLGYCLYDSKSPVIKLTKDNFQKLVLDSDEQWFIEFYAPWCGHCKNLAPSWEKAAKSLRGVVKVGAVDMTTDQDLGQPYGIQGFPTLKYFGNDKSKPADYQGQRDAESIVNYALEKTTSEVKKRLKGKDKQQQKSDEAKQEKKKEKKEVFTDDNVVVLNGGNFDQIYESKDIWFVEFYAPWCGHCKKLEPEYNEAATKLKNQVKIAKVDATVETELAQKFQIKGFPTIKIFDYGIENKHDNKARTYDGPRDAAGIINNAQILLEKADIQPDIYELISQKVYEEQCQGQIICIISFVPNIYDSNKNERQEYLDIIKRVAKKNRKHPFNFFWLQAGDQLDLERELNLGFGFPAVVAIAPHKKKLAIMKAAFNSDNLQDFLSDLISGLASLDNLKTQIQIKKSEKWDGKDAPPLDTSDEL